MRNFRQAPNVSETKSSDQRWFGHQRRYAPRHHRQERERVSHQPFADEDARRVLRHAEQHLLREGRLAQLTHDHASTHPDFSHQLLRCIGAEDWVVVDYSQGDLLPGDRFLLMTDGIHNVLNEGRLKALLDELEKHVGRDGWKLLYHPRDEAETLIMQARVKAGWIEAPVPVDDEEPAEA